MRILDDVTEQPLRRVWLYLTEEEARQLFLSLQERLLNGPTPEWHTHIEDEWQKGTEVSVTIYDPEDPPTDPRVREFLASGLWPSA
jgi:hypothetical protein